MNNNCNKEVRILLTLSSIYVGGFFIYTAYSKIISPEAFISSIRLYKMMPDPLNTVLGLFLPWLEVLCGLGVIFGIYRRASIIMIIGMLLVFIIALASAKFRGLEINCGCYGNDPSKTTDLLKQINIDIMLLLLSVWILLESFKSKKTL